MRHKNKKIEELEGTKSIKLEKTDAEKQIEVFELLKNGLTNLEIADIQNISYAEVLSYRIAYERRCKR